MNRAIGAWIAGLLALLWVVAAEQPAEGARRKKAVAAKKAKRVAKAKRKARRVEVRKLDFSDGEARGTSPLSDASPEPVATGPGSNIPPMRGGSGEAPR